MPGILKGMTKAPTIMSAGYSSILGGDSKDQEAGPGSVKYVLSGAAYRSIAQRGVSPHIESLL